MRTTIAFLSLSVAAAGALTITTSPASIAGQTYDFVVIGSGPGGLTVASRLSEIPSLRVLVIEAGLDQRNNSLVTDPGNSGSAFLGPGLSKLFFSAPQNDIGRQLFIVWGQTLGGSSSINGMQWGRGAKEQYDAWETLGNTGWNWSNLSSYMKKSERFQRPNAQQTSAGFTFDASAHGFSGSVSAGEPNPLLGTGLQFEYQDTVKNATRTRLPTRIDFSSGSVNGAGLFQYAIQPSPNASTLDNRRTSAADAYVYPFLTTRPNLTILTGYTATRMTFTTSGNSAPKATGVEFIPTAGGDTLSVKVAKEVIVAAGAIGSAAFLELSGIGNKTVLQAAGVQTVVDLPSVGTNLQDQFFNNFEFEPASSAPYIPPAANMPPFVSTSFLTLAQIVGNSTAGSLGKSLTGSVESRAKDAVAKGRFSSVNGLKKMLRVQADLVVKQNVPVMEFLGGPASFDQIPATNTWSVTPTLLQPSSRGSTHITSSNPLDPPTVDFNLLSDPFDVSLFISSMRFARRIASTPPMSTRITPGGETIPSLAVVPSNATDAEWMDYILANYLTAAHPVGTIPMLPCDMGGAVDEKLKVYGVQNVRVVDASIIPIQISAHPQATVYGIGEKAADLIKADL
ncbi:alcohol oxidase [Exidia glandulosa HHB12029]|uniref:Alcohol oxidase n=1 Tax=Exidia glandulosa HHB12029 TaxID=1314781 RepID=A0A165D6B4_EXIGL|nr:alcohol oxidase [Exidia glandulosa HHB12029]